MDTLPHERAAREYMRHKGYPDAEPFAIEEVEGRDCWYFYYRLPGVVLELEVDWDPEVKLWRWTATPVDSNP